MKLTEAEKLRVEATAVQKLLQEMFNEAILARVEEMKRDISAINREPTSQEIIEQYLGPQPTIATPPTGILVPK